MTDTELIAIQAKKIEELRRENISLKERMSICYSYIYCVGGPMNDNRLNFNKEQRDVFAKMASVLRNG
jgi:hypothetical protein